MAAPDGGNNVALAIQLAKEKNCAQCADLDHAFIMLLSSLSLQ